MKKLHSIGLGLLLGACSATAVAPADAEAPDRTDDPGAYVFVFLRGGPAEATLAAEEMQTVRAGHFANMRKLQEQGWLMLAGPFGTPRSEPDLRGIFILDTDDVVHAESLCSTDPAVEADTLWADVYPWRSPDPIDRMLELDREVKAEREARGEEGFQGRAYVLVTAADGEAAGQAIEPLVEDGRVLFRGMLGGDRDGELLFLLDAEDPDEARELLEFAESSAPAPIEWTLHPWWGTNVLEQLPTVGS